MPKVGAHVSSAKSLELSFERAQEIGAECIQIFISPPQQWAKPVHQTSEVERYKEEANKTRILPNFIHGLYLINLASANPELVQKSIDWVIYSQTEARMLGMEGTIFHIGSAKGLGHEQAIEQVIRSIKTILEGSLDVNLILENSAGAGELIGDQMEELGQIVREVNDPRLKICLDTQHAFASGYDLRGKQGVDAFVQTVKQEIGLNKLIAFHINDSKTEFESHRDRHENIGQGLIGLDGFRALINHPLLQNIPFILEVPGIEGKGPDKENIRILKKLISTP